MPQYPGSPPIPMPNAPPAGGPAPGGAPNMGPAPTMQDLYAAMGAFLPMMQQQQDPVNRASVSGSASPAQFLMGPPQAMQEMPTLPPLGQYLMGPR